MRVPWLAPLPLCIACARSSDRPAAPEQRSPVVVPAPGNASDDEELVEAIPERQPRAPEAEVRGPGPEPEEDFHVDVTNDGGVFSFSAKTVKDGGFSFRFSGSLSVSTDGGSVHVRISPDAGAP